ncbi:hypothetical protein AVDCRST_MAG94-1276 [uncultured Leptolyngbya sp.]|uniref:Uncharacterized protein n=1 Tax=uncultured Leptolyngbya sp. TaxID=332963 RepID=A0A6J4KW91_9CYAN|nr:hypothetical protein AVDCRST_MAG94-1276 [uncultured Leptolyngbya sp.]
MRLMTARGKSGLPKDQTCWVTPSASDREDSATERYRPPI